MIFAVVNESKLVSEADVRSWVTACDAQLQIDVGPAWSRVPVDVEYFTSRAAAPASSGLFVVVDSITVAGAEAYHTEDGGRIEGFIGVSEAQADGVNPSVDLSHELLEAFADPFVNASVSDLAGKSYDMEICDPVQDTTYAIAGVLVSGFVLPSWCDAEATQGPYDRLVRLTSAFQLSPGGYAMYTDATGRHQLGMKPARRQASLRSKRRVACGFQP